MKSIVIAGLALGLLAQPVFAQNGFAPGNPWFAQFESACRAGVKFVLVCRGSVVGAFAAYKHTVPAKVRCSDGAFWRVTDAKYGEKVIGVLPWQDVVAQVVAEPGVCHKL